MTFRLIGIAIVASLLAFAVTGEDGNAATQTYRQLADRVDVPFETFRLENGLTVVVHTDRRSPTVFVGMWYLVGSKDEPTGKTGFAHLFEHLMFGETENRKGEYYAPFTKAGVNRINGTTTTDRTNYFALVPTAALDMALWMESDRMMYLPGAITDDVLAEQRKVVKNEKWQSEILSYSAMYPRTLEAIYPIGHPYRHPVIGSMQDLNAATVEDAHRWFKKFYGASNAFLVLSGDIDLATAQEKVGRYFGKARPGKPLAKYRQWIPDLNHIKRDLMYEDAAQAVVSRTWVLPPAAQRDTVLMQAVSTGLVGNKLVGNKTAPLQKRLVDELQWASSVSGGLVTGVVSSTYEIRVSLMPGVDPEQVGQVIDEELEKFLHIGPDSAIIEASKLDVATQYVEAGENNLSIGFLLANGLQEAGDAAFYKTRLNWIIDADIDDLRDTANRWLSRPYYELTVLPFEARQADVEDVDRSQIPAVEDASLDAELPDLHTTRLENGIRLVFARFEGQPLVTSVFQFRTGQFADKDDALGTSRMVFNMLSEGTRRYSAEEFAAAGDNIGMRLTSELRPETTSFAYRVRSSRYSESLQLMAEMLRYPTFPEDAFEQLRDRYRIYLDGLKKNPGRRISSYFYRALYGTNNPRGQYWTQETLSNISRQRAVDFYQQELGPQNLTVYVVGDAEFDDVKRSLERSFGDWQADADPDLQSIGSALPAEPRVILVDAPGAEQSTVYAGHAIEPHDIDQATVLDMVSGVLGGGFDSRINLNLREDKGWSYGMQANIFSNVSGDQAIAISGNVQTDRTAESMREIMQEYRELVSSRPVTEAEHERLVLNWTRAIPGRFSTSGSILSSLARSGRRDLPLDYDEGAAERILAVTLDDVNAKARGVIDPDNLTWVVVGDLDVIEDDIRALGYGDVEVWDEDGMQLR